VAAFVAYVSAVHMGNHRPELKAEYAIRATHCAFHLRVLLGGLFGVQTAPILKALEAARGLFTRVCLVRPVGLIV
jgi:hypothetical protein